VDGLYENTRVSSTSLIYFSVARRLACRAHACEQWRL